MWSYYLDWKEGDESERSQDVGSEMVKIKKFFRFQTKCLFGKIIQEVLFTEPIRNVISKREQKKTAVAKKEGKKPLTLCLFAHLIFGCLFILSFFLGGSTRLIIGR